MPQSARLSAGRGVQWQFGQCPNEQRFFYVGASLTILMISSHLWKIGKNNEEKGDLHLLHFHFHNCKFHFPQLRSKTADNISQNPIKYFSTVDNISQKYLSNLSLIESKKISLRVLQKYFMHLLFGNNLLRLLFGNNLWKLSFASFFGNILLHLLLGNWKSFTFQQVRSKISTTL